MNETIGIIEDEMRRIYGFSEFKSTYQRDGVLAVLQGDRDVFINSPPNSGKSLCYQLPAIMTTHKSAFVFVQNNNTAEEHVKLVIGNNISVCHIDSTFQKSKKQERVSELKLGTLVASLIYIPISLCNKSWIKDLIATLGNRGSISFFVIDEAVHLSSNSTSFSKSSLDIVPLRNMFPSVPLIALTSCGSKIIKSDILNTLFMKNPCEIINNDWVLPYIFIHVKFKDIIPNPYLDLAEMINSCKSSMPAKFCGIVYCRTKKETIIVARELSRLHISTVPYNASMSLLDRKKSKDMWKVGKATMIAVTHSSDIGLDKPDITCIIHWSTPQDITEYYQELGKAGRGDFRAVSFLYFSLYDWIYMKKKAMGMPPSLHDGCEAMMQFCLAEECRHVMYSRYFESMALPCKTSCDWCTEKETTQVLLEAFNDLSIRHRLLSPSSEKNIVNTFQPGVYDVKNTENYMKRIKPINRFSCYRRLGMALIKNYESADFSHKEISREGLCRLARNLEYSQLVISERRADYMFALRCMIGTIKEKTMAKTLCNYILNYDCIIPEKHENIQKKTHVLFRILEEKTGP